MVGGGHTSEQGIGAKRSTIAGLRRRRPPMVISATLLRWKVMVPAPPLALKFSMAGPITGFALIRGVVITTMSAALLKKESPATCMDPEVVESADHAGSCPHRRSRRYRRLWWSLSGCLRRRSITIVGVELDRMGRQIC